MNIETIYSQLPGNVFWKDTNSIFLGCNMNFARTVGLNSPHEVIGKSDFDFIWGDSHGTFFQEGDKEVLEGKPILNTLETLKLEDQPIITIITNKVILFDSAGQKIGLVGNFADMRDINYSQSAPDSIKKLLTRRQMECLLRLVKGMTAGHIADDLGLSKRTVEHYLDILKIKLKCKNKSQLINKALSFDYIKMMLFKDDV